jgi:predicted nucleic acid-binding protein
MIAAVAIGDGAALATGNTSDFTGLEPLVHIITL